MRAPRTRLSRTWKGVSLMWLGLVPSCVSEPIKQTPTALQTSAPSTGRKRALLVGISQYPQTGAYPWRPLTAHEDVVQIQAALLEHGFAGDDVKILEDSAATADGIRTAFRTHLIDPARPGDTLFFHFSGHGQQVPDDNGDELDGLDETLVPADATDQRAKEGAKINLRDDEIGGWFKTLEDKLRGSDGILRSSVTVTLDSCFSGTATRGALAERGHGWDEFLDGPRPPIGDIDQGAQLAESMQEGPSEVQFLSAALSTQTAKEQNGMGVFSHALAQALRRADRQTTYRALLDDISYDLAQSGVRGQTARLEGNPDLILFRGEARPHQRTMRLLDIRGDLFTLAAGEAHLVTVGSVYALYRAGTGSLSDAGKLGEAEVVSVSPTQSVLRLRRGTKVPKHAAARQMFLKARAVETAHRYAERPLRVRLTGLPAELEKSLRSISMLTTQAAAGTYYDVELRADKDALTLYRPEAKDPFARVDLGPDFAAQVDFLLRAEWRWRTVMNLRTEDRSAHLKLRIVPVQCPVGPSLTGQILPERTDVPKTEPLRLRAGDCFQLELYNPTYNDLWPTVLQLAADGSIESTFPHPRRLGVEPIPPGKTVRIPMPYIYRVELAPNRNEERSTFKVIATTEPIDLSPLIQRAYQMSQAPMERRDNARSALELKMESNSSTLGPLVRLLADAAMGEQRGGAGPLLLDAWGVTTTYLDQERLR